MLIEDVWTSSGQYVAQTAKEATISTPALNSVLWPNETIFSVCKLYHL
jgi:hypothetical protein